jgi:hypothetical protein
MPLPVIKPSETRDEFVKRCMQDTIMKDEYPNIRQRLAVCARQASNID